jgi:hypothetical protein
MYLSSAIDGAGHNQNDDVSFGDESRQKDLTLRRILVE